jgi:hypothetical protein
MAECFAALHAGAIWSTGSFGEMAFAVAHCTLGDVMIAGLALLSALALFGRPCWPKTGTALA